MYETGKNDDKILFLRLKNIVRKWLTNLLSLILGN